MFDFIASRGGHRRDPAPESPFSSMTDWRQARPMWNAGTFDNRGAFQDARQQWQQQRPQGFMPNMGAFQTWIGARPQLGAGAQPYQDWMGQMPGFGNALAPFFNRFGGGR